MDISRSDSFARIVPTLMVLVVLALAASQLLAWIGVERAADAVDRGEAEAALESLSSFLRRLDRKPVQADLESFLEESRERGLVYVAIAHPLDELSAGQGVLRDPKPPKTLRQGRGRVRASSSLAPPGKPPGPRARSKGANTDDAGRPPPGHDRPPHDLAGPGPRRPPVKLTVELEPRLGAALRADAIRTMAAATATALLFLVLGFALRRAIREREAATRRAERDRHLAALGEMSAVLGHEIRNPLASLKGHAQLLAESLPEGQQGRGNADRVVDEAIRLEELTSNLLEFVRSGELHYERIDLSEMLKSAIDAVDRERFELTVHSGSTIANVDPSRMRQALINVLANASQASTANAEVTLEPRTDSVAVHVSDHGPGIPTGAEEQMFQPFHTTRVRGTGLGLPIAKRIVEAHHGRIDAKNRAEGGATFTIILPRRIGVS
ncbi:MAG: ATP-binding protein [Polyangiales bacterium]